jgi:hypothetical protein
MLRAVQGRHCRVTLPHLTGADLCVLGGLRHSVCWEPLARAWRCWTRGRCRGSALPVLPG